MIQKVDEGMLEQLALGLDVEEETYSPASYRVRTLKGEGERKGGREGEGSKSWIDPEEQRVRSEVARKAFEDGSADWRDEYMRLRDAGWPWRVAAYIAWAASPKKTRKPSTLAELANQVLGLESERVIHIWRKKNPAIEETVAVMQSAPLFERRGDIYKALIEVATMPDYKGHQDRKLALELMGDYTPRSEVEQRFSNLVTDLSSLSSEELARMAGKETYSPTQETDLAPGAHPDPLQEPTPPTQETYSQPLPKGRGGREEGEGRGEV